VLTLLAIDTAGSNCSAAIADDAGTVLAVERLGLRHGHAEALLPMIDRVTARAGITPSQIEFVAAAVGPGGFTGIRAGLAAAQGIVIATGACSIGVSSFAAVAAAVPEAAFDACPRLLVALDSRRADLYVQLFSREGPAPIGPPQALLPSGLAEYIAGAAAGAPLLVAGDAATIAATALGGCCEVAIAENSAPDALGVVAAALHRMRSGAPPEPLRPFYLRPPDVTLPAAASIR
jgi:tRNA threonylcarbamoyladenosine biosynthesis protein TsaB